MVTSRRSSPVNVKWYVPFTPADLPGWNNSGRPLRNPSMLLGRRPCDAHGPVGHTTAEVVFGTFAVPLHGQLTAAKSRWVLSPHAGGPS